jgi:hypothetical protein
MSSTRIHNPPVGKRECEQLWVVDPPIFLKALTKYMSHDHVLYAGSAWPHISSSGMHACPRPSYTTSYIGLAFRKYYLARPYLEIIFVYHSCCQGFR